MASYAGYKASSYVSRKPYSGGAYQPDWYRPLEDVVADWVGLTASREKQRSNRIQRDYDTYMMNANRRALNDWEKNVGSRGLKMRYPELSYPGAIRGFATGISRSYVSDNIARSEFSGSLPYRTAGLYGIFGRPSRYL